MLEMKSAWFSGQPFLGSSLWLSFSSSLPFTPPSSLHSQSPPPRPPAHPSPLLSFPLLPFFLLLVFRELESVICPNCIFPLPSARQSSRGRGVTGRRPAWGPGGGRGSRQDPRSPVTAPWVACVCVCFFYNCLENSSLLVDDTF